MPSAYHCIRCFEQQNKGQSEHESKKENMFETELPRVNSLNAGSHDHSFHLLVGPCQGNSGLDLGSLGQWIGLKNGFEQV